jgi:starch synthase
MKRNLRILYLSSEVYPFAKTGGLADVAGALPKALHALGHDIRVFTPLYSYRERRKLQPRKLLEITVEMGRMKEAVAIRSAVLQGCQVPVYFLDFPPFFHREGLYGEGGTDYPDNAARFGFFCHAALELIRQLKWYPDIIHGNDWQCGLIPLLLALRREERRCFRSMAPVFTIHNMAYQGVFPPETIEELGLPQELFSMEGIEYWGKVSLLKAGLVYSDVINTVSRKYATEIRTDPQYGMGLGGLLNSRRDVLFGIVNGVDYEVWNPAADPSLPVNYNIHTFEKKKIIKKILRMELNLRDEDDRPLIAVISRLDEQKGLDIMYLGLHALLGAGTQLVVLGLGGMKYHRLFERLPDKYPGEVGVRLSFDDPLGSRIYGGADMFLMPSRFEPCGLGQLIALRYGTVPIVRRTGGLADTILDYHSDPARGNGFSFIDYTGEALVDAVVRAVQVYHDRDRWTGLVQRGMAQDWSWGTSALKYEELYGRALEEAARRAVETIPGIPSTKTARGIS